MKEKPVKNPPYLSPAEIERLVMLVEEIAEMIEALFENFSKKGFSATAEQEIADVMAILRLLRANGDLPNDDGEISVHSVRSAIPEILTIAGRSLLKIACKILRHGYENHNPDDPEGLSNRDYLSEVATSFENVVHSLTSNDEWLLQKTILEIGIRKKLMKLKKYSHHQSIDL